MRRYGDLGILAPVAAWVCAVALAVVWAFLVPVFGGTDEVAHLDYAFALYDAGGAYRVANVRPGTLVAPQVRYAAGASDYRRMRYDVASRVPPGYGSAGFWRRFDAGAPLRSLRQPSGGSRAPYAAFSYPAGYYALIAWAMLLATWVSHGSLGTAMVVARLANCAFLGATLWLAFRILRRRYDRTLASLVILAFGTLPIVSSQSGYVQPDNLSLLLMTAAFYAATELRVTGRLRYAFALSFCITALFLVKQHYAVALWLPSLAFLAAVSLRSRLRMPYVAVVAVAALLPALAFALSFVATPVTQLSTPLRLAAHVASGESAGSAPLAWLGYVRDTAIGAFGGGIIFDFFWFRVTTRELIAVPPGIYDVLRAALLLGTLTTVFAVARRRARVMRRIATVVLRRSRSRAAVLITSDVAAGTYACLTALLAAIFASTHGRLELVGRYWVPVMLPMLSFVLTDAIDLIQKAWRRRVQLAAAGILAASAVCADGSALTTTYASYYGVASRRPQVEPIAVARIRSSHPAVAASGTVEIDGCAVNAHTGLPAERIAVLIDGRQRFFARTGRSKPKIAQTYHDDAIERCGFLVRLPARSLGAGRHVVSFAVIDSDPSYTLPFARVLAIDVTDDRVPLSSQRWISER